MSTENRWKPNDWIRLVALIGAFALFILGAWMLFQGIAAEGSVDLKSSVISGTLKTASAGLYICFFAFFVIIFVLVTLLRAPSPSADGSRPQSRVSRLLPVFWGLLVALGTCTVGAVVAEPSSRTAFFSAIGLVSAPFVAVVFVMIRMAAEDA